VRASAGTALPVVVEVVVAGGGAHFPLGRHAPEQQKGSAVPASQSWMEGRPQHTVRPSRVPVQVVSPQQRRPSGEHRLPAGRQHPPRGTQNPLQSTIPRRQRQDVFLRQ
jgi:hypothetical protein